MSINPTKYYVKKYKLDIDNKFNHQEFIKEFRNDFNELLIVGNARGTIKGFNNAVHAIRAKWDGIHNKTVGGLPDKLWNYFYATEIITLKKELFPEYFRQKEREKREREQQREQEREFNHYDWFNQDRNFNNFDWFYRLFGSWINELAFSSSNNKVGKSFEVLGLDNTATADEINREFKKLAIQRHPDHGGTNEQIRELLEARQVCLDYRGSHNNE